MIISQKKLILLLSKFEPLFIVDIRLTLNQHINKTISRARQGKFSVHTPATQKIIRSNNVLENNLFMILIHSISRGNLNPVEQI